MSEQCLLCGAPAIITPSLIGGNDRWDCTACAAWGTVSAPVDDADEARLVREQAERVAREIGGTR